MIGDPSGREAERGLNDAELVAEWVDRIGRQVEPFLELGGETGARIENNLEWTRELDVISYLRDVGKFFSVNAMIGRESVRNRLQRDDEGISYTEFSYMLLQAYDYWNWRGATAAPCRSAAAINGATLFPASTWCAAGWAGRPMR